MLATIRTHKVVALWLVGGSFVLFIATLIVVPWLIIRIPADYFADTKRPRKPWAGLHPLVRGVLLVGKNLLGYLLIVIGAAMLVLPGQGVLTILLGFILVDLPGKYRFVRWLVARPLVLRTINRLRQRAGREPLVVEE